MSASLILSILGIVFNLFVIVVFKPYKTNPYRSKQTAIVLTVTHVLSLLLFIAAIIKHS